MERKMTFDELWETEERQGLEKRLQRDYPVWRRQRRTRRSIIASVALVAVISFSIFNFQFSISKKYDSVCCNRNTFPESHWVDVASNILTTELL